VIGKALAGAVARQADSAVRSFVWFSGVPGDFRLALWLTLGGCAVGRCLFGDAGTVWSMSAGCAAVGAARASAGASSMVNLKLGIVA
jgi:hypothetical protein